MLRLITFIVCSIVIKLSYTRRKKQLELVNNRLIPDPEFMALALRKDYSMDEYETKYLEITQLFDYAEELVATVESKFVSNPERQVDIVEPLINEIGEAADILCEEFLLIAESKRKKTSSRANKSHIEASLRRLFAALTDYEGRVRDVTKKAQGSIMNIADPVVSKIQRQVEEIVIMFLEMLHISVHSIMSKSEYDALKARDARLALLMHQYAQTQQQG